MLRGPGARLLRRPQFYSVARCTGTQPPDKPTVSATAPPDPLKAYTALGGVRGKPAVKKDIWHYSDRRSGKGYSDFSTTIYPHAREYIWPPLRKMNKIGALIIIGGLVFMVVDFERVVQVFDEISEGILKPRTNPEAKQLGPDQGPDASLVVLEDAAEDQADGDEPRKPKKKDKKKKIGFRERRIIQYTDRIRNYSTPDKVFRYFATLKVPSDESGIHYEVYMTPEDFVRSFTPGVMQPPKYGIDRFKVYRPEKYHHHIQDRSSIFYKLGETGLISFSDYLFLKTLLSTSPKDFALAFSIFDINGDGALDRDEFYKIKNLVMSQSSIGLREMTPGISSHHRHLQPNSALETYFFGPHGTHKLSADKFLQFQADLHRDILKMEFERRDCLDGEDGIISELSFAQLLLLHANIDEKKMKGMLKRVRKKYQDGPGITFEEVVSLFALLYHIEEVDMALHFHRMAGVPIDANMLQHVARKVTNVELTAHVVDVVITLFDENMDGKLSNREFVAVMRRRMRRGLEHPRDTGVFRLAEAVVECSRRAIFDAPLPLYQLRH